MFGRIADFFRNPWVAVPLLAALAVGAAAAVGRFLLGSWLAAVIVALAIALGVVLFLMLRIYLREARSERLDAGLEDTGRREARAARDARGGSRARLERGLREALSELRRSRLGADALYALPWLLVIGETGAGKTALIARSGLELPAGRPPPPHSGPTQTCEFWLADDAVVLDTPGAWLGDSDDAVEEWETLLRLLRAQRPQCPLNGVVVALSAARLLEGGAAELEERGRLLRQRLNQLKDTLGLDVPVYLVVTQADRIEGFADTVAALPPDATSEVFGWTNAERRFADAGERVREGFADLCERLDRYVPQLVAGAADATQQRRLFLFPQELEDLASTLAALAERGFRPSVYNETPFLRGVYLTSARREGETRSALLERLGAESWARARHAGSQESAFVRDLFRDVLVGDADLALPAPRLGPRERRAVLGVAGAAAALLVVLWSVSFALNWQGARRLAAEAEAVRSSPSSLESIDRLRTGIEEIERGHTLVSRLGLGHVDRALERAKRTFVWAFRREFEEACKIELIAAVRDFREEAFEALVALALDVVWLEARADPQSATRPLLGRYARVAPSQADVFHAAYDGFVRWAPAVEREVRIERESRALDEGAERLFDLPHLEAWSEGSGERHPPLRYADLGLPAPESGVDPGVSSAYTARGWEGLVRNLLESVRRTGTVGDERLRRFERGYALGFDQRWHAFLLGLPTSERADPDVKESPYLGALRAIDANTRAEVPRRGPLPPWLALLRETLRDSPLPPPTDGEEAPAEEAPPWERYEGLLDQVATDVAAARVRSEAALDLALQVAGNTPTSFEKAPDLIADIVPGGSDSVTEERLERILLVPILDGLSAVLDSALDEVDRRWSPLAGRYGAELADRELRELYDPSSGELAKLRTVLDPFYANGAALPVLGRELPFGPEFLRWMRSADAVQRALFAGAELAHDVRLDGVPSKVRGPAGLHVTLRDLRLICGTERPVECAYTAGTTPCRFRWTPRCQEVSLSVYVRGEGGAERELQPRRVWRGPLAFPNFLHDESVEDLGDGRLLWRLDYRSSGIEVDAEYRLVDGTEILDVVHRGPPRSVKD